MSSRRHAVIVGVLATLLHSQGFAALNSAGQALLQQGLYWQEQSDSVRATEIWKKLLLIDPQQIDALYGLGLLELQAKRAEGANRYLNLLRTGHPGERQTLQLEQAVSLQSAANLQRLDAARQFAESGELDKAVAVYRQIFADKAPQGDLGLEYYGFLSYTKTGWNEARQGLERLIRVSPDDARIKLVLAKLLLLNESTRLDGIGRLAQLSTLPQLGGEATESWRAGLVWLGSPRAAELPLFEQYLKANPADDEIRTQMTSRNVPASSGGAPQQNAYLVRGFKALQDNNLEAAEQAFLARLKEQPQDADAQGGLGIVRQRQGRFSDANELLGRAVARSGNARWRVALESNRYWSLLTQATAARADHDIPTATRLLQQAITSQPRQIEGLLAMASLQAEQNQLASAEAGYRQALTIEADNPDALLGLITVLAQSGKAVEGQRLIDGLSPVQQQRIGDLRPLRAAVAAGQAKSAERIGDLNGALAAQQSAVRNDPKNVWMRYDLARLYLLTKSADKARQTVDELVKADPQRAEALYVSALLSSQLNEWSQAQLTLERIPVAQRSAAMQDLARDIRIQSLASQATTLAKQGNRSQAISLLRQAEVGAKADLLGVIAAAYVEAGDITYALSMLRNAIAQSTTASPSLRLAYAAILLKSGDDVQVSQILHDVQSQPLQPGEQRNYDDVLFQYTVRQADLLREKGDLVAAYDTIAPALAQRPEDPQAVACVARMYLANNDAKKAIALYQPLLAKHPEDAELQIGMAMALHKAGDRQQAEKAVDKAVELAPNNPQILVTAAGLYRAQGRAAKAADLYSRALALQDPARLPGANPFAGSVAANPFVGAKGQRAQSRLSQASLTQIPEPATMQLAAATDDSIAAAPSPGASRSLAGSDNTGVYAPLPARTGVPGGRDVSPDVNVADTSSRQSIQTALNQIRQERSPSVTQGVTFRGNNSESGLNKINDVETPLEISFPLGDDRLALRVTPVWLNAGGVTEAAEGRFGSGPAISSLQNPGLISALSTTAAANLQSQLDADPNVALINALAGARGGAIGQQKDNGVGLAVAYENPALGLKSDLGTSPLGFLYSTVIGGISLDRPFSEGNDFRYSLNLSRRPVTDSLTSFAGARDGRSGLEWGGVTANGGRLQVSYDNGDYGAYGYGALHKLVGNNVESNSRAEGGTGVYWYALNDERRRLTAGVSLTGISYDKNQSNFTYGNGGYFSPQNFFSIGLPVSWSQRTERLSYTLKGSVGLQHIEQDTAPYFPNDKALQNALTQVSQVYAASGITVPTQYAGQTKSGLGYSFGGAAEYRFGNNFFFGGQLGLDNARDYKQWSGGMYLRYMFEDFTGLMSLPVSPYHSPYSN